MSSDREKAAEGYVRTKTNWVEKGSDGELWSAEANDCRNAFLAGAAWGKKRGAERMREKVEEEGKAYLASGERLRNGETSPMREILNHIIEKLEAGDDS
jgi:hypothetical protein